MRLIFGGTTEGKQLIRLMQQLNKSYHYSTKTKVEYTTDGLGIYRHGALDATAMSAYIQQNKINLIINAAHPFASTLHQTIAKVSQDLDIPVYRVERTHLKRQEHPLIHYVNTYDEALEMLLNQLQGKKLLGLSGVQSIAILKKYWKNNPTIFRILDRPSSVRLAEECSFPVSQLILAYPNKELRKEIALYQQHQIDVVLTKESGNSGQLDIKIAAIQALDIPIIIIKKPLLPTTFKYIDSIEKLKNERL